ncbi:hypothetical protein BDV93DRAFT_544783 [Ceratobasidium sp. AG-I]|nr:hypothetical protein BDV93DRAFT_544783 [Ceratobasidium sp. AG-I]
MDPAPRCERGEQVAHKTFTNEVVRHRPSCDIMANLTSTDATLSPINSSPSRLCQTRPILSTPHARDFPSLTINDLPTEILCYIFKLAKVYCTIDALSYHIVPSFLDRDKPRSLFSPDNISPVTPSLWTHVDLSIGRLQDTNLAFHAQRSLEHAKQLPLHIHVDSNRETGDSRAVIDFLAPYANRIASLDLSGNVLTARSILLDLFGTPYRGSVQHLYLHDEDYKRLQELQDGLFSSGLLDEFLLSIPSLTLEGPALDYNSPAFRDLTELAIIFSDMRPTPYQLTQILAACPALCSFTLISISLTPGDLPRNTADLPNLQVLDLRCMSLDDVVTVTSCIIPRRGLSISFTLSTDDDSYIDDLSPLLSFFKRFHIARLFLNADYVSDELDLETALCSLGEPLPSLEELALDGDLLRDSEIEGGLLTERFPRLRTLHVIGSAVPVDQLKIMLASSPIQVRAKQLPLHIHVSSNRETGDSQVVVASLAPYANRIISLDLSGNVFTAQSILLDLFSIPYCGSVQRLYLHDEDFETLRRLQGRLFSSRLLDEFLLSISSLTLEGPSLDYNSPTFRDLTELALIFSDMSPTPYQLTQILAACPALRSFTLINIMLTPGNLPSSAANLSSLQILDLRYVSLDDVATITSCIIPRRGLSMSLTLNMDDDSHIRDLSPLLPFFKQFHVSRLFLNSEYVSEGLDLRAVLGSLRDPLPSLEELALDVDLFRGRELEGGLLAERFPRLHTLHIIGSTVPVDRLKMMLASSPIRVVQFRWRERHPSEVLHAISKVVSSVLYSLHDTLMDNRPFPWELPSISYYDNGLL